MKALFFLSLSLALSWTPARAVELRAGVAKIEITDRAAGPVHDPLFAKALVLQDGSTSAVLITIDAVALGEIGRIKNTFVAAVRGRLEKELGIPGSNVMLTTSHCHGIVRNDLEELVVQAVKEAWSRPVPVKTGAGLGREDRISENRRLRMKDGSEVDMRRAYSMPPDEDVSGVGPIDPQIGILRLDRASGGPLAVVYQFACHPIQNPPNKGNSADYPGVASRAIEETLGQGALAFFIQGCCGDINPVRYKEVSRSPEAEPLGALLGLSVLRGLKEIAPQEGSRLAITREIIALPRGTDLERRMAAIESRRSKLVQSLKPTNINFRSFLPLLLQEKIWPETPSHYSQSYLHDKSLGRDDLSKLDADNRNAVTAYLQNIRIMEELTRLNTNHALLKMHLDQNNAAGNAPLPVEVAGLRVGDFKLVTFPGELTVETGLEIKKASGEPHAFVSGYTNGYIYYTPTVKQRNNAGFAQEDCDCVVGAEWQAIFEANALEVLKKLSAH